MMTRRLRIIWRCIVALALASICAASTVDAQAPDSAQTSPRAHALEAADLDSWLDGYLPYALRSGDIAGAVVVVVKDGKVLTERGYGSADLAAHRPVDPERTLFRVGSISKLFTWTAVMQQVEAGKLDLDRDVNSYLDFRIPPYRGKPVTLRELMTHTAGFELAGKDTITFGKPIALDTFLKRWIPARIYPAATTPAYSNWGAALAGYIVQRSSGLAYADYVQQRILAPLGMRNSTFQQPLPAPFLPFMSKGYLRASDGPLPFETIGPQPAGALSATGADMARFMIAHLEGGAGLMRPETAAEMHNSPLTKVDPQSLIPPLNRMELGFIQMNINGHAVIGHGGDTQQFHSLLALFVNDGIGLFVSLNSAGRDNAGGTVRNQIFEDFADRYFPAVPDSARVPPDAARRHARMMTGQWLGSGHAQSSFLALASLAAQTRVSQTADGRLSIPALKDASGAPQQWDEVAPFVWRSRVGHDRIAAQLANRQVVRWSTDLMAPIQVFDRVPVALSAAWIVPALCASLAALLLTFLYWPASWFVRRRYRWPIAVQGKALTAYRAVRIASLLDLVLLAGWMALLATMLSNFDWLGRRSDGLLLFLQICGLIVFVAAAVVAGWNALLTWRDRRTWPRKLWNSLVAAAALMILYFAYSFGLLSITTNY